MPQDSLVSGNRTTITYPGNYDSLPAAEKHVADSIARKETPYTKDNRTDFQKQSDYYSKFALPIVVLLFVGTWYLLKFLNKNPFHLKLADDEPEDAASPYAVSNEAVPAVHVYYGSSLNLPEETITDILVKRFSYFNALPEEDQKRFLLRHKKFMADKIFKIHETEGFREMPVLISAAAIQFSFGLQEYMLEEYSFVNIFPQEFMRAEDTGICLLEGNVSGNNIKISWKHFLDGYRMPDDGDNVGLHEMAHAYYCQNFMCGGGSDSCFVKGFPAFEAAGKRAFEAEKKAPQKFYSEYALKNFQEFWAESAERFFERGGEMKNVYPDVYRSMSILLNQSPVL